MLRTKKKYFISVDNTSFINLIKNLVTMITDE